MIILFEKHEYKTCGCSYCGTRWPGDCKLSGKLGLSLPEDKGWNSWRVIYWTWYGHRFYLRWTLPKWVSGLL